MNLRSMEQDLLLDRPDSERNDFTTLMSPFDDDVAAMERRTVLVGGEVSLTSSLSVVGSTGTTHEQEEESSLFADGKSSTASPAAPPPASREGDQPFSSHCLPHSRRTKYFHQTSNRSSSASPPTGSRNRRAVPHDHPFTTTASGTNHVAVPSTAGSFAPHSPAHRRTDKLSLAEEDQTAQPSSGTLRSDASSGTSNNSSGSGRTVKEDESSPPTGSSSATQQFPTRTVVQQEQRGDEEGGLSPLPMPSRMHSGGGGTTQLPTNSSDGSGGSSMSSSSCPNSMLVIVEEDDDDGGPHSPTNQSSLTTSYSNSSDKSGPTLTQWSLLHVSKGFGAVVDPVTAWQLQFSTADFALSEDAEEAQVFQQSVAAKHHSDLWFGEGTPTPPLQQQTQKRGTPPSPPPAPSNRREGGAQSHKFRLIDEQSSSMNLRESDRVALLALQVSGVKEQRTSAPLPTAAVVPRLTLKTMEARRSEQKEKNERHRSLQAAARLNRAVVATAGEAVVVVPMQKQQQQQQALPSITANDDGNDNITNHRDVPPPVVPLLSRPPPNVAPTIASSTMGPQGRRSYSASAGSPCQQYLQPTHEQEGEEDGRFLLSDDRIPIALENDEEGEDETTLPLSVLSKGNVALSFATTSFGSSVLPSSLPLPSPMPPPQDLSEGEAKEEEDKSSEERFSTQSAKGTEFCSSPLPPRRSIPSSMWLSFRAQRYASFDSVSGEPPLTVQAACTPTEKDEKGMLNRNFSRLSEEQPAKTGSSPLSPFSPQQQQPHAPTGWPSPPRVARQSPAVVGFSATVVADFPPTPPSATSRETNRSGVPPSSTAGGGGSLLTMPAFGARTGGLTASVGGRSFFQQSGSSSSSSSSGGGSTSTPPQSTRFPLASLSSTWWPPLNHNASLHSNLHASRNVSNNVSCNSANSILPAPLAKSGSAAHVPMMASFSRIGGVSSTDPNVTQPPPPPPRLPFPSPPPPHGTRGNIDVGGGHCGPSRERSFQTTPVTKKPTFNSEGTGWPSVPSPPPRRDDHDQRAAKTALIETSSPSSLRNTTTSRNDEDVADSVRSVLKLMCGSRVAKEDIPRSHSDKEKVTRKEEQQ